MQGRPHQSSAVRIAGALDWWQHARDRWARIGEVHALSSVEIERLATDVGLTSVEFLRHVITPDGITRLLRRRLGRLDLDDCEIERVSQMLARDLEKAGIAGRTQSTGAGHCGQH